MPNDIATQATWQIDSASQGNKRIRRMKSWDIADGSSVEAVGEVGSPKMVAFKKIPGALTFNFEIRERKGAKMEVDWFYLKDSEEVHAYTKQIVGGRRTHYPEGMVSKIDEGGADDAGEIMYTVEVVVLEAKRL